MQIKKAIFLVAGLGTRFLPATKAQPKEMLTVVDKPTIQYIVEQVVDAGIHEIIFVTGRGKTSIENHFDKSYELEQKLREKGKMAFLKEVEAISDLANFAYVRQPVQKGDGNAIMYAYPFVDVPEPVLFVFPDYIMPRENNTFTKLIDAYNQKESVVIGVDSMSEDRIHEFGTITWQETDTDHLIKIKEFVEKPPKDNIPDGVVKDGVGFINIGCGVLTETVWEYLKDAESTVSDGEIRIADAFTRMLEDGKDIYAVTPTKSGYDCGSKIGFLKATVDLALERDDLKEDFAEFIKKRAAEL